MDDLDKKSLEKLNLTLSDLQDLTKEEQGKKVRKQYLLLACRHHPDKVGKGETESFIEIDTAYRAILSQLEDAPLLEINSYLPLTPTEFPDTAFDLLMEESILARYQALLQTFHQLSDNEKQQFAQYHKKFINLAQTLENKQSHLMDNRSRLYSQHEHDESFWQAYQREWRKLIISLFGEEYLDDFQYRHAIAIGGLRSVLTWRKLLSPVKVMVALLNSIILLDQLVFEKLGFFYFIAFLCTLFTAASIILPIPLIALLNIVLLLPRLTNDFLYRVACPINTIVRPLAQYTGCSHYVMIPMLAVLAGILAFAIISTFPILSTLAVTVFLDNSLIGFSMALAIALCDTLYSTFRANDYLVNKVEMLPFPTENVPDEIRETVLQEVKTSHYSARLFNTPKEAAYLVKEDRTIKQQISSFFGGGKKTSFEKGIQRESFTPAPLPLGGSLTC